MDQETAILQTTSSLHMSDVIEVLQKTEPDFGQQDASVMYNSSTPMGSKSQACVKIIEQPASKALRFRYECEGRSAGSIPGANSTPENKTFPTIQVIGYQGRAVVVVSCVTKDAPYRPHPHNLVGKEGCKKGVCTVEISGESMTATFSNLGIQCVKKKDIDEALRTREEIRVDPYRTGFAHRSQPTSIDLNAVRLCFQVFLEGAEKGKFTYMLPPVVSDPIYDKKAMSDLVICKLSDCSASVGGGREIILLCEKVAKEDIQVRFFTEEEGRIHWEGFGDFTPASVHKQVAISFRTPRYRVLNVDRPVNAFIQLRRPSDGATSEALPFTFTPLDLDPKRKKPKQPILIQSSAQDNSQPQISCLPYPDPAQPTQPPLLQVKTEQMTEGGAVGGPYAYSASSPMYVHTHSPQHITSPHLGRTPSPMEPAAQQWPGSASVRLPSQQQQLPHRNTPSSTPEFLPSSYCSPADYAPVQMPGNVPGSSTHSLLPSPMMNQGPAMINQPPLSTGPGDQYRLAAPGSVLFPNLRAPPAEGYDVGRRLLPGHAPSSTAVAETGGSSLPVLDSKINSADLSQWEPYLLSESLSTNLSLGEEQRPEMSDSLTRLIENTAQSVCDLNNMLN